MKNMLDGKTCIVTGGGRGIGRATCLLFAQEGGKLVVCEMDEAPASETVDEIKRTGGDAVAVVGDITADGIPEKIVQTAMDAYGDIGVIVNNAGYTWDRVIQNVTDQQWDAMINIHLTAPFRILRAAAPVIREKAKAEKTANEVVMRKVVNISSDSATKGVAGQTNYASAKAGLIGLTKALSKEWGRYNVTVNCICFGTIETRLTQEKEKGKYIERHGEKIGIGIPKEGKEFFKSMIALGRTGTPEDAAKAIFFLASPLSDYLTGQVLTVDGGAE